MTTQGLEGSIVYEFLAVPRHQGTYEIPPVTYTYFDLKSNSYKTVSTEAFSLKVAKGEGGGGASVSYTAQEDVRQLNSDIRYIKTGDARQHAVDDFFFGSTAYWLALGVLLGAFATLFVVFRHRAIANADVEGRRAGKANKVAVKRLKKAAALMRSGKEGDFYDEVLRALWDYVGDKLSMPIEQLSRDNITEQLSARDISSDDISRFISAIDECEFARFAPGDAAGNMSKVYDLAMSAITAIDSTMRKGKKSKK